jgi:hypothetical protein
MSASDCGEASTDARRTERAISAGNVCSMMDKMRGADENRPGSGRNYIARRPLGLAKEIKEMVARRGDTNPNG